MTSMGPASFARPQRAEHIPENRGSMLRASILESAIELGIGTNRTVAHWLFNPVDEVEEEESEDIASPSLTYASTATSEESNLSAGLAQHTQPGAEILINGKDTYFDPFAQYSQRDGLSPAGGGLDPSQRTLHFNLQATPELRTISPAPSSQTNSKNKLRKARPDGYESDGGYMSESGKAKKEKKEKEKEKKDKKKSKKKGNDKDVDGGATEYESDGGYLPQAGGKSKDKSKSKTKSKTTEPSMTDYETDKSFSSAFSRRKQSVTSPISGDESDGGYLSESSKKKRFFRLNSKSRKKQDSGDSYQEQPPPVPALPVLPLPIHEKFSRAGTPLVSDSRNATPVPSETSTLSVRPSVETFTSMDTTTTSVDTHTSADTSSTTVESQERRDSLLSNENLTRAFQDAESVRSPSIDFLSTFRRPTPGSSPLSPSNSKLVSFSQHERPDGPVSPSSPVPPLSSSKSVRSRPKISAPNTISLAPKHTPVPLTLTPPTPTGSHAPHRIPPSPDPDYVLVTPNPQTPVLSSEGDQSNSNLASTGAPPSPGLPRPHVLAYYDLPPPSPPPRGPLPDVPSDISRSTSPSWSMMAESPASRFPRSAPLDVNDPRGLQQHHRPQAYLFDRPSTAIPHPLSRQLPRDVPTIAQPVPPIQRGRVSPFPTAPVLPREQTTTLMRQTSKRTKEAVTRALRNGPAPASANPYTNPHGWRLSHERVLGNGPASAQPYPNDSHWPSGELLGVQRQLRPASAVETRRPKPAENQEGDDGRSWLVYDDDDDEIGDRSLSLPHTRSASTEPQERSPDVNAILAGFRAQREAQDAARRPPKDKADMLSTRDTLAGIVAGYQRDTMNLDADEGDEDRSSVWSEANSRYSFLDGEKSAAIRAKFLKGVEAMYGKEIIPPVPPLEQGLSPRSG